MATTTSDKAINKLRAIRQRFESRAGSDLHGVAVVREDRWAGLEDGVDPERYAEMEEESFWDESVCMDDVPAKAMLSILELLRQYNGWHCGENEITFKQFDISMRTLFKLMVNDEKDFVPYRHRARAIPVADYGLEAFANVTFYYCGDDPETMNVYQLCAAEAIRALSLVVDRLPASLLGHPLMRPAACRMRNGGMRDDEYQTETDAAWSLAVAALLDDADGGLRDWAAWEVVDEDLRAKERLFALPDGSYWDFFFSTHRFTFLVRSPLDRFNLPGVKGHRALSCTLERDLFESSAHAIDLVLKLLGSSPEAWGSIIVVASRRVVLLNGRRFPIRDLDTFEAYKMIAAANGAIVSSRLLTGADGQRLDRDLSKHLPQELFDTLDPRSGRGGGYALLPGYIAQVVHDYP